MRFFFYGTLLDADVRKYVFGRRVPLTLQPAVLRGWRSVSTGKGAYPILLAAPGRRVTGVLTSPLSHADALRLDIYEGDGYTRRRLKLDSGGIAQVYLPVAGHPHDGRPWALDVWRRTRKAGFMAAVRANRGTAPSPA